MLHSIRTRISIIFISALLLTIAATLAFAARGFSVIINKSAMENRDSEIINVARAIEISLENDLIPYAQERLNSLSDSHSFIRGEVLDVEFTSLMSIGGNNEQPILESPKAFMEFSSMPPNGSISFFSPSQFSTGVAAVLTDSDGDNIGILIAIYDDRIIVNETNTAILNTLTNVAVFLFALGCLCFVLFNKSIAPLSKITKRIIALSDGDLAARIPFQQDKSEIGALARSIEQFRSVALDNMKLLAARAKSEKKLAVALQTAQAANAKLTTQSSELSKMAKQAQEASIAKSQFLATMSHEIRTPMNGVLGMAELLCGTKLDEKQQQFANVIHDSGSALLTIINDILDFSKIESGFLELDPEPFSLTEMMDGIANLLGSTARSKGIELVVHCPHDLPIDLVGDQGRVRQILTNLAGNAVKFTHEGYVVVSVSASKVDAKSARLRFEVKDTGIGIPDDKIESIFEHFTQAEGSTTRRYGGTGLGLSISRSLINAMDGELGVLSSLGEGSTFWFEIEFDLCARIPTTPSVRVNLEGVKILVVDDLDVNRNLISEHLISWGAEPVIESSAAAALKTLHRHAESGDAIPLVLTDYQMPNEDGLDLVHRIRSSPNISDTSVVVLSSIDERSLIAKFDELNVVDVITKPITMSGLQQAIATALGERCVDVLSAVANVQAAEQNLTKLSEAINTPSLRVLIAEDNLVNRMVVESMIDKSIFEIQFAENGLEALNSFKASQFDLVFMDISMPEMDGVEATKAIRSYEAAHGCPHTPIIALTAHVLKEDVAKFLDSGMDDFLSKPVKKNILLGMCRKWTSGESAAA